MSSLPLTPPLRPGSVVVACVTILVGLVLQTVLYERSLIWKAEGGPIEVASAVFFAVALVIALVRLVRRPSPGWLAGTVMLLWAVLRELDFQKAFTYRSIESLGFYTRPIAPLWEKLLAITVLVPFVIAAFYLVRLVWRTFRSDTWRQTPWVGHFLVAVGLLVIAQGSEKVLGFDTLEETCETGMALIVVLLTWTASRTDSRRP